MSQGELLTRDADGYVRLKNGEVFLKPGEYLPLPADIYICRTGERPWQRKPEKISFIRRWFRNYFR